MDRIAKAIIGGLTTLGGALVTALGDGHVTATEWVLIIVAGLTTAGAVWATPNTDPSRPIG